jgi:class 3 adenylate cyclase
VPTNKNITLPGAPEKITSTHPILKTEEEAERRHLTVMFCDLVGSTALSAKLDPEDLRYIVTEYQKVCQKVVARYEGHIAQYLGDGILVYFGYPIAHENDAHRAVSTGLRIIEAIEQLNVRLDSDKGINIQVRIGIHTGHTVIGDILDQSGQNQRLAHGATLNIAARLEGLATPDTMVISNVTYELVNRHFVCEDKGEHIVKGIDKPIKIYHVIKENTARARIENQQNLSNQLPLFGREDELKKLLELWEAAKENRSHIALLNGGAGVGKSRLLYEFVKEVANESDVWLIMNQCSPYHKKTAFYPFVQGIKREALNLEGHENSSEQINRLEGFLLQNGLSLEDMIPIFASIMNIDLEGSRYQNSPYSLEQQQEKIANSIISFILERVKKQPLLITFEDLQWIDEFSLQVLHKLIQQSPTVQLLVVMSFRPEFTVPWRMQAHLVPISLTNLPDKATRAIIQKISRGKRLPKDLTQKIIQKTDGVPLFVEELTKMVLNSDMVKEFDTHYELTQLIDSLAIPSTLQDSLIARLNNMPDTKAVAQIGAAIGREFSFELIKAASGMKVDSLRDSLEELIQIELLLQQGVLPKATFKFRHALIRDAAYQSLLNSQQIKIHSNIANSLSLHFPEKIENNPQIAAYHYEKANQNKDAIIHWTKAGEKLRKRQAFTEALDYLQRGLNLIQKLDKDNDRKQLELALLSIQTPVFLITEGYTSKPAYLASIRMSELAEKLGDKISLFHALRNKTMYQIFAEKPQNASKGSQQVLAIAKKVGEVDLLIEAYRLIGQISNFIGKHQEGLDSFNMAIKLYLEKDQKTKFHFIGGDPLIFCLIQSCQNLWYLGYPDQSAKIAKEALSKASEKDQIFIQALCLYINSFLSVNRGDIKACTKYVKACFKICKEYGIKQLLGEIEIFRAYLLLQKGEIEKGSQLVESAFKNRAQRNINNGFHFNAISIIQTYLDHGALEKGLDLVAMSLENFKLTGELGCLAEIYRLQGELLFAKDKEAYLTEIQECYQKSWKLAKNQKAKSFELRTAMSFLRLGQYKNDIKAAKQRLSETYNWFTEGFGTEDMMKTKKLLNSLT